MPTTPHHESHQERAWNSQPNRGPATKDIPRYTSPNAGPYIWATRGHPTAKPERLKMVQGPLEVEGPPDGDRRTLRGKRASLLDKIDRRRITRDRGSPRGWRLVRVMSLLGSSTEVTASKSDFRSAPKNGHHRIDRPCRFRAICGHTDYHPTLPVTAR